MRMSFFFFFANKWFTVQKSRGLPDWKKDNTTDNNSGLVTVPKLITLLDITNPKNFTEKNYRINYFKVIHNQQKY